MVQHAGVEPAVITLLAQVHRAVLVAGLAVKKTTQKTPKNTSEKTHLKVIFFGVLEEFFL